MKRLNQILPVILAVALQIMPLLRNFFVSPAAGNTIAFILRWGIGSAAVVGSVDAVSGASPSFISTTNFTGSTGSYFSNSIVMDLSTSGNPASTADGFTMTNLLNLADYTTNFISNGKTTTKAMPAGLTFRCISLNNANYIYGSVTGTPSISGTYYIRVGCTSPGNGSKFTNVFFTISGSSSTPPNITNQPISLTNNVGSNATFSVIAGGTAPLSYQWFFNTNTALLNQTNASLSVTNVQLTNAGNYQVIITNSAGSVTSSFASLAVWQPPVITNQPVSVTNTVGNNTSFNVVAGGSPAVGYQWYFNTNTPLVNATNATLLLNNLQLTNAGYYSCTISSVAGSVISTNAQLTVWQPPVITNQPSSQTAVAGGTATFSVVGGGLPVPVYQWFFNGSIPLAGATTSALVLTNLRSAQVGSYSVVLASAAGSLTSSVVSLTVTNPLPPVVVAAPVSLGGAVQINFASVPGLTNVILTNGYLSGGTWGVYSNIPPSPNSAPITIADLPKDGSRFYRLMVQP